MEFRTIIRILREEFGYSSQSSFGNAFGVAQTTVAGWEGGKRQPNFETLIRLADFFSVSTDYLLGQTPIRHKASSSSYSGNWNGCRLKEIREQVDESESYTAESLGISKSQYLAYEQDQEDPPLWLIVKICEHFGVNSDYLLGLRWALCDSSEQIITDDFKIKSKDEQRLIERFRLLSPIQQGTVFGYIDGLMRNDLSDAKIPSEQKIV